jgi:hypothetical protein
MYLSTDMSTITDDLKIIENEVNYIYSIKPDSIPYNNKFGIRVKKELDSNSVKTLCESTLSSLSNKSLSLSSVSLVGRNIDLLISYKTKSYIPIQLVKE